MSGVDGWVPDEQTLRWVSGILHEDRIVDTMRAEVGDRQGDLEVGTREWWVLVTSIAVEHVTFDLGRQAALCAERSGRGS